MTAWFDALLRIFIEISPFVVIGMLAAGFVHEALGQFQKLRAFATRQSLLSLSFFNFSGFTLPICSCGVVPLAVGMRSQGVPFGNVFTFIFSAPATSIAAVVLSFAVLGSQFTMYFVIGALLCGYIVGLFFYLLERRRSGQLATHNFYLGENDPLPVPGHGFVRRALRWGTLTYGSRIAFDLVLGLVIAAALISTYSVQALGSWFEDMPYWQAGLLMVVLAIPLYVCSLPGIIVSASLVLGGFSPALIWVFLLAGPVTNLGDINVLRRTVGWRYTGLYILVVVVMTLLWGAVIDANLQWEDLWSHVRESYATQGNLASADGELGTAITAIDWLGLPPTIYYACAAFLAALTLNGAWQAGRARWQRVPG